MFATHKTRGVCLQIQFVNRNMAACIVRDICKENQFVDCSRQEIVSSKRQEQKPQ